jgi:hypothetical protein
MHRLLFATLLALSVTIAAQAEVLINYNTTNTGNIAAMPVESTASEVSCSDMTRGSGLGATSGHSMDAFGSNIKGSRTCTNLWNSFAANCYFTWTVTPDNPTHPVAFSNLTYYAFIPEDESGTNVFWNPIYALFSSETGLSSTNNAIAVLDSNVTNGAPSTKGPFMFDLTGVTDLQLVTGAVDFRLYYWSKYQFGETVPIRPNGWENIGIGADDGQSYALSGLYMEGFVIPEPALGFAAIMLAALLRRRII